MEFPVLICEYALRCKASLLVGLALNFSRTPKSKIIKKVVMERYVEPKHLYGNSIVFIRIFIDPFPYKPQNQFRLSNNSMTQFCVIEEVNRSGWKMQP